MDNQVSTNTATSQGDVTGLTRRSVKRKRSAEDDLRSPSLFSATSIVHREDQFARYGWLQVGGGTQNWGRDSEPGPNLLERQRGRAIGKEKYDLDCGSLLDQDEHQEASENGHELMDHAGDGKSEDEDEACCYQGRRRKRVVDESEDKEEENNDAPEYVAVRRSGNFSPAPLQNPPTWARMVRRRSENEETIRATNETDLPYCGPLMVTRASPLVPVP